mmetsp:Transcript_16041/g.48514  ORF Transcript_16041/g.48514 Transcript_16041/m.48514 type:complete len:212 (-) Transcript_16041:234-869(-)
MVRLAEAAPGIAAPGPEAAARCGRRGPGGGGGGPEPRRIAVAGARRREPAGCAQARRTPPQQPGADPRPEQEEEEAAADGHWAGLCSVLPAVLDTPSGEDLIPAGTLPGQALGDGPGEVTLVVERLSGRLRQDALLCAWPADGSCNFACSPCSSKQRRPARYAFVNFTSAAAAQSFMQRWHGRHLPDGRGGAGGGGGGRSPRAQACEGGAA